MQIYQERAFTAEILYEQVKEAVDHKCLRRNG